MVPYESTAGLVGNHDEVLTREDPARVRGHDGERKVDALAVVVKDLRNVSLAEVHCSLAEGPGICLAAVPELASDASFVVGLHAELGGALDMLVQMRLADKPAHTCREDGERPELAAVVAPTARNRFCGRALGMLDGLHAELGGALVMLVKMRLADKPAHTCREDRERPELAAVATPTARKRFGGICSSARL